MHSLPVCLLNLLQNNGRRLIILLMCKDTIISSFSYVICMGTMISISYQHFLIILTSVLHSVTHSASQFTYTGKHNPLVDFELAPKTAQYLCMLGCSAIREIFVLKRQPTGLNPKRNQLFCQNVYYIA